MATTLVHAPWAANTPSPAPEYPAGHSATVHALAAHVELVTDLLAALYGLDPPPSKPDSRSAGSSQPGLMSTSVAIATLLETLGSGNRTLDHLVQVLANQLEVVRPGGNPGGPDRGQISADRG